MIAGVGGHGVNWKGVVSTVLIPAMLAPTVAVLVATVGTWLVYRAVRNVPEERANTGFRYGQIGSASLVSLAHGTNDAQKTMGVIFLALISYGAASKSDAMPPFWVIVSCAVAIALGTYVGGWRVIRTLGKGLVDIKSPQGMAAETSSAAVILLSSHFGYSLSTTHVATGSILGSRDWETRCRGALGGGRPDDDRLAPHAARRGHRRRDQLLHGAHGRRFGRYGSRLIHPDHRVGADLSPVPQGPDRPHQRQPRVAGQLDCRHRLHPPPAPARWTQRTR